MAYRNNGTQQHAFRRIDQELRGGDLKNLLLFFGKEKYLIQWAVDAIVGHFVNDSCKALDFAPLDGDLVTVDELIAHGETLPLMSQKRVVLIRGFKWVESTKSKNLDEAEEKRLIQYLKNFPESCLLVLLAESVDKRKRLTKTITEAGSIYDFCELDERALKAFIEKKVKEAGKTIRSSVINELVSLSGYFHKETEYTLYHLDNDIKKAVAHADGQEVLLADISATVAGNLDTNVFALLDDLSKGRKQAAFQMLHHLLLSGENEYLLLSLLCSHFELMLSVKEMEQARYTFAQMKEHLGVHEFRIKKAVEFSQRFSLPWLRKILHKSYNVDQQIKSGFLSASLALELLMAQVLGVNEK